MIQITWQETETLHSGSKSARGNHRFYSFHYCTIQSTMLLSKNTVPFNSIFLQYSATMTTYFLTAVLILEIVFPFIFSIGVWYNSSVKCSSHEPNQPALRWITPLHTLIRSKKIIWKSKEKYSTLCYNINIILQGIHFCNVTLFKKDTRGTKKGLTIFNQGNTE